MTLTTPRFAGADYDHARDSLRLSGQLERVYRVMITGQWRTLKRIAEMTGDPEASVSAQLRHLRKERFGSHIVTSRYIGGGLYEYHVSKKEGAV